MWSRQHKKCVQCSRTEFKHMAHGWCSSCYAKEYKKDPAHKQKIDQQKTAWYWQHHEENLLKRKLYREQRHYAGKRDEVLQRDDNKCTECGSDDDLVVHHIDGQGRGKATPNNALDNLVTLCRSCHMKEHSDELKAARRKYKI